MQHTHIGTKMIRATPMTRADYNTLRGWELPANENGKDDGYLVEYLDGGKANQAGFDGYVSWSPRDVFDRAYRPAAGLSFGMALEAVKLGRCVARAGWNGKGMMVFLIAGAVDATKPGDVIEGVSRTMLDEADVGTVTRMPALCLQTPSGSHVVGWLASQTDMLADDWAIAQ